MFGGCIISEIVGYTHWVEARSWEDVPGMGYAPFGVTLKWGLIWRCGNSDFSRFFAYVQGLGLGGVGVWDLWASAIFRVCGFELGDFEV